ncbi:peptidyl-tRNA hydrolase, mitochondrial-like [Juglans microcarpa x Juglans regia]|uniref:peptidyl-tRNA hydrolase, mitochondrial-like n=1 Tax=Juglans microcarpa x Juglans regia TaxID=2249226 RepID=UPI001B7DB6B5|nr:peptidyl-tRNA hydrolase, mitochondrial-like [Juglans microcarpa x Juglans regia]
MSPFKVNVLTGFIGDVPVMFAKPQTFVNASDQSVGAIVSYYKIPLKQVLAIFDDLDLPFAKLRLLPKGGHGGHNGMRIIIDHFKGNRDFPHLRIGIGRPPGKMDPVNFVLRPFNKLEREELNFTFQHGLEAVRILLLEGFNNSASFANSAKTLEQLG